MTLGVLHVFKLNWLFKYVNFTNYVLSQKPHYLKLILVISYGLLYLVHCINLINDLVFNYKHFIIVLVTIAILYSYYKIDKIDKDNSPT